MLLFTTTIIVFRSSTRQHAGRSQWSVTCGPDSGEVNPKANISRDEAVGLGYESRRLVLVSVVQDTTHENRSPLLRG